MTLGIIGLGLIGGSLARALTAYTSHHVLGWDRDPKTCEAALESGAVHRVPALRELMHTDLLILAVPPQATRAVLEEIAPQIAAETLVIDCCGVKRSICSAGFEWAAQYGFTFMGGHPMAGREQTGFTASLPTLFQNASMLLVPAPDTAKAVRQQAEKLFLELGFKRVLFTTAEHHDRMIALTSQLAHVVSSAFVKSPRAVEHAGFSAGSFADLTRVACLDEHLWSELLLENRDFLIDEMTLFMGALQQYYDALKVADAETLVKLLRVGRECKELI